jgi:hypothetical protein
LEVALIVVFFLLKREKIPYVFANNVFLIRISLLLIGRKPLQEMELYLGCSITDYRTHRVGKHL